MLIKFLPISWSSARIVAPALLLALNAVYCALILIRRSGSVFNLVSQGIQGNQGRVFWVIATLSTWVCAFFLLQKLRIRVKGVFGPSLLLASAGIGLLLILFISVLGVYLPLWGERIFFFLPLLFFLGLVAFRKGGDDGLRSQNMPSLGEFWSHNKLKWIWLCLGTVSVAAILLRLSEAFTQLAWLRGPAVGDEFFFWWSYTDHLLRNNFFTYLNVFEHSSYYPGYPFIGVLFLGLFPDTSIGAVAYALPLLLGLLLLWSWLSILPHWPKSVRAGLWVIPGAVLLQHDWVFSMFFTLWYGEALAVLVFFWLIFLLERDP
ncbi:MAG TPA: hypothetical protein VEA37_10955, partial [Flavobacterium sp.]|nr:hypothetical protein [Flavobacterium sp.]